MPLISGLGVCLLALIGIAWSSIDDRLTYIERNSSAPTRERIAALEVEVRHVENKMEELQEQLSRIEMRQIRAGQE
jgi:ubiquinone biosynthesis protein UbiJ